MLRSLISLFALALALSSPAQQYVGTGPTNSVLGMTTNGVKTEWKRVIARDGASVVFSNGTIYVYAGAAAMSNYVSSVIGALDPAAVAAAITTTSNGLVLQIEQTSTNMQAQLLALGLAGTNYTDAMGQASTNYALTIGGYTTNYADTVAGNASNSAIAKASADLGLTNGLLQTRLSNYVNTVSNTIVLTNGILATNYTLAIAQNNTNFSLTIGSNSTNYALAIGSNATNYINTVGGNASNSAIAKASADLGLTNGLLQTRLSNYVNTVSNLISLTNGILATNFALQIGSNGTNYANTVAGNASNSVVGSLVSNSIPFFNNLGYLTNSALVQKFGVIGVGITPNDNSYKLNVDGTLKVATGIDITGGGGGVASPDGFSPGLTTNHAKITAAGTSGSDLSSVRIQSYQNYRNGVPTSTNNLYVSGSINSGVTNSTSGVVFSNITNILGGTTFLNGTNITNQAVASWWLTSTNNLILGKLTNYADTVAGNASNSALSQIISSNYVAQAKLDQTNMLILTAITNNLRNYDPNFITNGSGKIALAADLNLTNVTIVGTLDAATLDIGSLTLSNQLGVGVGGTGLTNLYSGLMMGDGTNAVRFATPIYSLYFTNTTNISLAGDASAPGNSKYYGTDGSGVKGFYTLPAGGGGGTALYTNATSVTASNLNFVGFLATNDGATLSLGLPATVGGGNDYDTDYFYTNGSSKVSLLTNLYLPFATIGTATITNSIFLDPVFTNLLVYGPLTSTNLDARLAAASNSAMANIQSSNYVTQTKLDQTNLLILGTITNATNGLVLGNNFSANFYTNAGKVELASTISVANINIDAATITNFNAISATFSNVTVTNFVVVTQTVDVLVVSNLQALSVGITNSTGTNVIGKTLFTDWISLTNSGVTNVIAGGTTVSNLAVDGTITSTNLTARLGDTNSLILSVATNLAKLNVSTNGTLASAGPTNVTITFLNASTTVPASLKVINTATGAVTYALSGTMPVVLYKTNANYNLTIVSATSTNVVVGDAVWVDVQTDGATWYLRY